MPVIDCDRGRVANDRPAGRAFEIERESCLQVRLIEAWKGHAGVHGHKQSVEVFVAIVFVFITCDCLTSGSRIADECEREGVLADDGGEIEMAILELLWYRTSIECGGLNHTVAIVDGKIAGRSAFEGERFGAGYS